MIKHTSYCYHFNTALTQLRKRPTTASALLTPSCLSPPLSPSLPSPASSAFLASRHLIARVLSFEPTSQFDQPAFRLHPELIWHTDSSRPCCHSPPLVSACDMEGRFPARGGH